MSEVQVAGVNTCSQIAAFSVPVHPVEGVAHDPAGVPAAACRSPLEGRAPDRRLFEEVGACGGRIFFASEVGSPGRTLAWSKSRERVTIG